MKRSEIMMGLVSFCLLIAVTALAADNPESGMSAGSTENVMMNVPVRDLNKNPGKFAGQQVVVTGKVSRIEGANAFILEGTGLLNNKILVVIDQTQQAGISGQKPGAVSTVLHEKEKVQLTGRIEDIGITRIEQKYKPGLKAEIKAEFEGNMPVLVVPPSGLKTLS